MRRLGTNALIICSLFTMTGCAIIPSFPDLWPFDDDISGPVPPSVVDTSSSVADASAPIQSSPPPGGLPPLEPPPPDGLPPLEPPPSAGGLPPLEPPPSAGGLPPLEPPPPSAAVPPVAPAPAPAPPPVQSVQLLPQTAPVLEGLGGSTTSAPGATTYIISPTNGAVLTNPVRVIFGLDRMGIAPATLAQEQVGHHHLIIDTVLPPLDRPIPVDDNHLHFSGGQTETTLNLPIGQHTLQLLLGDHNHVPHRPPVASRKITITVQ